MTVTVLPGADQVRDEHARIAFEYIESHFSPQILTVTALPSGPADGDTVDYLADSANGVMWRFKYRAASTSTHKWEFVGGASLMSGPLGNITTSSGSTVGMTGGPTITLPLAGDYEIEFCGQSNIPSPGGSVTSHYWSVLLNGAITGQAFFDSGGGGTFTGAALSWMQRSVNQAAGVVVSLGVASSNGATSITFGPAWLKVRPVRVG